VLPCRVFQQDHHAPQDDREFHALAPSPPGPRFRSARFIAFYLS
jgi:hypothetical protein